MQKKRVNTENGYVSIEKVDGKLQLTIESAEDHCGAIFDDDQVPVIAKLFGELAGPENKAGNNPIPEALRLTPEERKERRERIGQIFGLLWEHRDEVKEVIESIRGLGG